MTLDRHPETQAAVIVARHGERTVVHPREQLEDVLARLSRDGFFKHNYMIGKGTRVKVDARYGKAKVQQLEETAWKKVSGGREDIIRPDNAGNVLKAIGIMKENGSISAREHKKYKQINDFLRVCKPVLDKIINRPRKTADFVLEVSDLACGNSYLAFVLAWYLQSLKLKHRVHGIDSRQDVIDRSIRRAGELSYSQMSFEVASLRESTDRDCHLAVSLHGCDKATDEAIIKAVVAGAEALMIVPCCQNEVFLQLEKASAFPELCKQSLYRRAYATVLTDSLRALALEALGYKVKVLEFTAALHTSKSLMIRAEKARGPQPQLKREFQQSCQKHGVKPAIMAIFDAADGV
ncbi:MAG: SAM-dependent methyltransferase [Planctomycetota bacterium]|nr:SAM-dependent methyltransferase [Planctomycetota bacterium]